MARAGEIGRWGDAGPRGGAGVLATRGAAGGDAGGGLEVAALEAELRSTVGGEVRFDSGSRALYAMDASNYRQPPVGVVVPRDRDDVIAAVAACRLYGAPLLARGGGTSLAGQCCNAAVVLDMSKYLRQVLELDPARKVARVEPGVVLDDLRAQAERHHLTFGPDPATHNRCTLGGMIGNNSCGAHSVMAGKVEENVVELDVLTYDGLRLRVGATGAEELEAIIRAGGRRGEIYAGLKALRDRYADLIRARYPDIPRRVSGYNLNELLPENGFNVARALVGSEGTCVTVLEATLRLIPSPPARALVVLGYPDIYTCGDRAAELLGYRPVGLEGFDDRLVDALKRKRLHLENLALLPEGGGWLLVEFGGETRAEAEARARELMEALRRTGNPPDMRLYGDPHEQQQVWEVRESGLGGTAKTPGGPFTWPGWEDSAVPPERFGAYLRDLRKLLDRYDYVGAYYGHFGQACLHTRIDFDLKSAAGIAKFRAFMEEAADLVVGYGGSLSGEHGDGQARGELLAKMYGPELVQAFREFKRIWDPDAKMNPGKVVDAYRVDQNLRLGTGYNPAPVATHFAFAEDGGSFAEATLRCVGVGKCRRMGGGTMCPSFMVTREEADSTRGRAHLLWEMLRGEITERTWRNEHVKDALDLCLACKGCKGECPVNVDMATYKAEFLSHYYAGRLRPPAAYAMGLIYWWAELAARMPRLVNAATHAPMLGALVKRAGGVAPQREMPRFAPQTFTQWYARRGPGNPGGPRVMLWPDTFNNHFHPETAIAAVEVLEAAGYQVVIPDGDSGRQGLCCGRPLYDFGMLDLAERMLRRILESLRAEIRAGLPIVVLEPSCASVFRDELVNLFPEDEDAIRLKQQTFMLGEFLAHHAPGYRPPRLRRTAVVHAHCHHKAVFGMRNEDELLRRMGLDHRVLDDGCCGMAGAFGFEREHYDVSIKVGERALLPAVRGAAPDTLIVSDGYSCREQIAQTTDRQALHLAQVLQMALREGEAGPAGGYPEAAYVRPPDPRAVSDGRVAPAGATRVGAVLGAVAGAAVLGAWLWRARGRGGRR